jgi:hypothetical protein
MDTIVLEVDDQGNTGFSDSELGIVAVNVSVAVRIQAVASSPSIMLPEVAPFQTYDTEASGSSAVGFWQTLDVLATTGAVRSSIMFCSHHEFVP